MISEKTAIPRATFKRALREGLIFISRISEEIVKKKETAIQIKCPVENISLPPYFKIILALRMVKVKEKVEKSPSKNGRADYEISGRACEPHLTSLREQTVLKKETY